MRSAQIKRHTVQKRVKVALKENLIKERTINECVDFARKYNYNALYCLYEGNIGYTLFTPENYSKVISYLSYYYYGPIHARIRKKIINADQ